VEVIRANIVLTCKIKHHKGKIINGKIVVNTEETNKYIKN
jgi:hypothetical protein